MMRSDRVLNFEFMSGDRTFKSQNDRSLKFNQQDNGDRTMKMIIHDRIV